jgi:hypothetical protein
MMTNPLTLRRQATSRPLPFDPESEDRDGAIEVGEQIPHMDDRCLASALPLEDRLAPLRAPCVDDGGRGPPAEPASFDRQPMTAPLDFVPPISIAPTDLPQHQPERLSDPHPGR